MIISNLKFFIGGGAFWSEIPERGFLENLDKNLLFEECACASQIVSHILRMWRLITSGRSGRASRQDHFFSISESFSIKRTAAHPRGKAEY